MKAFARSYQPCLGGSSLGFSVTVPDINDPPALFQNYVADAERHVVAMEATQPFIERAKKW